MAINILSAYLQENLKTFNNINSEIAESFNMSTGLKILTEFTVVKLFMIHVLVNVEHMDISYTAHTSVLNQI